MAMASALGLIGWRGDRHYPDHCWVNVLRGQVTGMWCHDRVFDIAGDQEMPTCGSSMELRLKENK